MTISRPAMIGRDPTTDPVQPRTDRALPIPIVEPAMDDDEHVLDRVLDLVFGDPEVEAASAM